MSDVKVIGQVGTKKYPIRITLSKFKDVDTIDIRKYYTNKKGEIKPSKKGITFTRTTLYPILKILSSNIKIINDYFDIGEKEETVSEEIKNKNFENFITEQFEGHKFFKVESYGSEYKTALNKEHPFGKKYNNFIERLEELDKKLADEAKAYIAGLLNSYFFAKSHFEPEEYYTSDSLFMDHEISWSSRLKRVIKDV